MANEVWVNDGYPFYRLNYRTSKDIVEVESPLVGLPGSLHAVERNTQARVNECLLR